MWNYFFALLWVVYVLSTGIHIFSRGFLLSRQSLLDVTDWPEMRFCTDTNNPLCLTDERVRQIFPRNVNATASRFTLPRKSKVLLLVIDALKYDFGLYDPNNEQPLAYQNKMPIIQQLLKEQPENTRFIRFVADPPTTTLQRLKALTTGSLPTFIDVGSNFATPEINEDNIIDQLVRRNRNAVFLGDSTWTELYPNRFIREYPFPSFNIYDLDTVDTNIQKLLPGELRSHDWDLMIAHFLGVDHCGHKHGPMHSEMGRKLLEMNRLIEEMTVRMDDDTTLIVIGDHGMTATGDHGGDSPDEVNAMLFAYSKHHKFHVDHSLSAKEAEEMQQIDLVPTLSIILGVPIPFSNLGQINFNLLPATEVPNLKLPHEFLLHSLLNVHQMRHFQTRIVREAKGLFDDRTVATQDNDFNHITSRTQTLFDPNSQHTMHKTAVRPYLMDIQKQFRDVWVKFDASQMWQGLLFVSLFSVLLFIFIANVPVLFYPRIFSTGRMMFVYVTNALLAVLGLLFYADMGFGSKFQGAIVLTNLFNVFTIALTVVFEFDIIVNTLEYRRLSRSVLLTRALFFFNVAIFFSNSFIVYEQQILCYTLMGIICTLLYKIQKTNMRFDMNIKFRMIHLLDSMYVKLTVAAVFAVVLLRWSQQLFRCREEHGNCTEFTFSSSDKMETKRANQLADILPVLVLAFFVVFTQQFLKQMDNLCGLRLSVMTARYGPVVCVVCTGAYFTMSSRMKGVLPSQLDGFAWVIYAVCLLQVVVLCYSPLLVNVHKLNNSIPFVFNEVKSVLSAPIMGTHNECSVRIPWTDGLRGAYSATYIATSMILTMLVALLLGAQSSTGIVITIIVGFVILLLSTILRFQTARSIEKCLHPEFLTLLAWTVVAQYSFYATGHQSTLSQIQWKSAFVGRLNPNFQHNGYISAALVLLNTFGGTAIIYLSYPLLCVFGSSIYARFSSLIPKPHVAQVNRLVYNQTLPRKGVNHVVGRTHYFELERGDLNLYEKEETLKASVFRTGCQLMVLQGFRIFCSMLACTIHCRHLMVWKVFAPKFIYEGISSYVAFGAIVCAYLILVRVHAAVGQLLNSIAINKGALQRLVEEKKEFEENVNNRLLNPDNDINQRLAAGINKHLQKNGNQKLHNE